MKKILLMLSLVMVFVFAGCTVEKDTDQGQDNVIEDTTTEDNIDDADATEDDADATEDDADATEDDADATEDDADATEDDADATEDDADATEDDADATEDDADATEDEVDATEDEVDATEDTAMTMEEILDAMYAKVSDQWPMLAKQPLTEENMEYMLGVTNFDFIEGIVSEPMMTSQAHSVVLFTVDESADIEAIKADIKANVDGRKWICVSVEDENILVDNVGNSVILIMDERSQELMDAYKEIMQ